MKYCTLFLALFVFASCARKSEVYDEETAPVALSFVDSIPIDSLEQYLCDRWNPDIEPGEIPIYTLSDSTIWMREDGINTDDAKVRKLVDVYNLSIAANNIFTDFDLFNRMNFCEEDVVNAIQTVDFTRIRNEQNRDSLEYFRKKILFFIGSDPSQFDLEVENPYIYRDAVTDLIGSEMQPFIEGLEYETLESAYFDDAKVEGLTDYYLKRGDAGLVVELRKKLEGAKTFDAQCAYALELAHAYDANHENARIIPIFESLMNAGKYSIYLFEMWRTWRCILQPIVGGHSRDSYIPNDKYNVERIKCAYTTLVYLQNHLDDKVASNQYLVQSVSRNIERDGVFIYGNQIAIEEVELFRERFNFSDEEEQEEE